MSEKPESEEFEDEDGEDASGEEESLDVDRLMQDLDKRKRSAARGAEPAWRKLERLMEQKRTSAPRSCCSTSTITTSATGPSRRAGAEPPARLVEVP